MRSLGAALGRFGLGLFVGLLVVSGGVGSAWATTGHGFVGQFGGDGDGDGLFAEPVHNGPSGVAVLGSSGDVFTVDAGQGVGVPVPRVQRFSDVGVFASRFAIGSLYNAAGSVAVDPAGEVYVSANRYVDGAPLGAVVKLGADGTFAYELDGPGSGTTFNNPLFGVAPVAVDPVDGSVFVAATDSGGAAVVDRFDQAGVFEGSFDGSSGSPDGFGCVSGLAVAPSHDVYVFDGCPKDGGPGRVVRYDAMTGAFEATVDDGSDGAVSAVAVDPTSGEVYVAKAGVVGSQVTHYAAGGGSLVYTFEAPDVVGVRAMAVGGDGTVYTSDVAHPFVERFTRFAGPTVSTTAPPSGIGPRSATLDGTINPEGLAASYHFEYGIDGTNNTYPMRTPEVAVEAGNSPITVSADVSGLAPNLAYHYRIVGSNDSGTIIGLSASFTTAPAPASVDGIAPFVTVITPRSARIHGSVNPNRASLVTSSGFSATYYLEWGRTTAYGATVVGADGGTLCLFFLGCGGDDVPVVAQLSGLEPGTTYHFRAVGDNGTGGAQRGVDQSFVTSPAAGAGARDVTVKRATLTGTINPHGRPTTYHFNYGPTSSYGVSTPEVDGGAGDGDRLVSAAVAGLSADRTYHVQVVATTDDGTSKVVRFGGDGLLRTALAPTAEAIGPEGVSSTTAVLAGEVDTHGLTGSYHFDVSSLDSSYSTSTMERPVAGGASAQRANADVGGLPAGERFVVSLTVTSNDADETSDLVTFATPELPRVFPTAPTENGTEAYGCGVPRLDAYNRKPRPGDTIAITGRDLGLGGGVVLGDRPVSPSDWSATGFRVQIPDDASGTLGLTVDCGHRSNTIAIALFQQPDNTFSVVGRSVTGSVASLTVRVPGPGKLESSAARTRAAKVTINRAGTATIKVRLSAAGVRTLRRAKSLRLKAAARLRYTPAGGQAAVKTVTITYKANQAGR